MTFDPCDGGPIWARLLPSGSHVSTGGAMKLRRQAGGHLAPRNAEGVSDLVFLANL
jgi:hypothetical protein